MRCCSRRFLRVSSAALCSKATTTAASKPSVNEAEAVDKSRIATSPQPAITLDAEAIEKLKIAEEIGEKAFEENTEILKKIVFRGLRAMFVGVIGLVAFSLAMKRKKRLEDEAHEKSNPSEDPTQRYLQEMRGLGFDVDGLEEELAKQKAERK